MQQAELVPRIHPFTANAALTAVLLTCTLGSASDPASASYLLTDITPQWRAFAHAASAALERPRAHSSGRVVLPFSCAGVCQYRQAPVTVHRMAYYKHKPKILCFFIGYYTRYLPVLQEPLQFFLLSHDMQKPSRRPGRALCSRHPSVDTELHTALLQCGEEGLCGGGGGGGGGGGEVAFEFGFGAGGAEDELGTGL